MFIRNTQGADLLPGLITAIAIAALGLIFVIKIGDGIKKTGDDVSNSATTLGGSLGTSVGEIIPSP